MTLKKELIHHLESLAPRYLQEDYDNSGWQCGNADEEIKGVLVCLDVTEKVVKEAIQKKCNLIIAHHPVIFKGIKSLSGNNYMERVLILAIKNDISIYAIHTNLDNVSIGVNHKIAEKLSLKNTRILSPKSDMLQKLAVFCPIEQAEKVRFAMCNAGAGKIGNYSDCSFNLDGTGTFMAHEGANPFVGEMGQLHREKETRIEVLMPVHKSAEIIAALEEAHPYEVVAYDIYPLANKSDEIGSGMIGELEKPLEENIFMNVVKKQMEAKLIRHTELSGKKILKVAVCGGSGRFLLNDAIKAGADVFITADFKYHDFFDADGKILVLDIGHFESEHFTPDLIVEWITKRFSTFAVQITETNTNPVNYF